MAPAAGCCHPPWQPCHLHSPAAGAVGGGHQGPHDHQHPLCLAGGAQHPGGTCRLCRDPSSSHGAICPSGPCPSFFPWLSRATGDAALGTAVVLWAGAVPDGRGLHSTDREQQPWSPAHPTAPSLCTLSSCCPSRDPRVEATGSKRTQVSECCQRDNFTEISAVTNL